jgi:hypothetical protein
MTTMRRAPPSLRERALTTRRDLIRLAVFLLFAIPAVARAAPEDPLVAPADGAVLATGIPHFLWRQTFEPRPDAMPSYEIEIATDDRFSRIVDKDRLAAVITRYVPAEELAPGDYWWRVAGVDAQDSRGPWSPARRFTVRPPDRVVEIPRGATFAQIQAAFAEAAARPPALVRFEPGEYRLDPEGATTFIDFKDATDLVVDGRGASLTFTGFLTFVRLEHCSRVLIKNFTFDYDPLPYTAGRVLAVDARGGTFDVEIMPGHPSPESNPHFDRDRKGMVVDPAFPRVKRGVQLIFEHAGWDPLGAGRYRFKAANRRQMRDLGPGDVYVLAPRIAGGFAAEASDDVTFLRLTAHAVASECYNSRYADRLAILQCGIRLKPGRFLAANNGGNNHHNARLGPWIEGCTWENTGDDICHVSGLIMGVDEKLAPAELRLPLRNPFDPVGPSVNLDIEPGDVLQFFDREAGRLLAERTVVGVTPQRRSLDVTLDGDVGNITPGRPGVERTRLRKMPDAGVTQVFNASRNCDQFVFRNNTVRNGRRIGVIAKGRGGLIEHNTFTGLGGGAVEFWNAPFEGLGAVDYVVRDNRIHDCGQLAREDAAIWAVIFPSDADRLHRNLLISDNEISGSDGHAIWLRDVQNAVVRGNVIEPLPGNGSPVDPIALRNTESVRVDDDRRD